MRIIKLNATDSTNTYLKNVMQKEVLDDFTIVMANEQLEGRGQRGTIWKSEAGKNLTISVLKKFSSLLAKDQFSLNIAVSTAVYNTLKTLQITDLKIKWPNDILSGNSKICGILIENVLQEQKIVAAVIGIGLNVNQQTFNGLMHVSSIRLLTGRTITLDEVLQLLLTELRKVFKEQQGKQINQLRTTYEELLFRKDKPSTFKDAKNTIFMGFIRGISNSGKLKIEVEDKIIQEFDFKEVQLIY